MKRSIHDVAPEHFNYVWDNAIAPALEVEPGDESRSRSATPPTSRSRRLGRRRDRGLDFEHVNPVSGPVFVKGARPGDVLAVEMLELAPRDWGWTAIIPGFGLLADEFPEPWLRISRVDERTRARRVLGRRHAAVPAVPGHDRRRAARARPALDRAAEPLRRQHGHQAPARRHDAVSAGRRRGSALLAGRHARRDGRRRGLRHRGRDRHGRHRAASLRRDFSIDAPQYEVPRGLVAARHRLARLHGRRPRPDGGRPRGDARDDRPPRGATRAGRQEAYALASVAADLRIHEVVDAPNWVVGLFLPQSIFD